MPEDNLPVVGFHVDNAPDRSSPTADRDQITTEYLDRRREQPDVLTIREIAAL